MADTTADTTETAAPKKGMAGLLIVAALVVAIGGAGGWFFLHRGKTAQAAAAVPEAKANEFTLNLDSFTVNLADPEESHFLRVTMGLGLGHAPKEGATEKGGDFPIAKTRDSILSVLSSYKANTLMTPDGKAQLKRDLLQELRQKLPDLDVKEIYFTEFLVQR